MGTGAKRMFELVFNPGTDRVERLPFTVSEAQLEDGIDVGRVETDKPFDEQLRQCAYHMVLELQVCNKIDRISEEPWVLVCRGKIFRRNHLAMGITEHDLG